MVIIGSKKSAEIKYDAFLKWETEYYESRYINHFHINI